MANYADSTRTPRTLTEREQRLLLKVTGEHRAGYRDQVLYAMALGTGLREHELIALSVGDVFRDGRPRKRLLLSVFKAAQRAGGTQAEQRPQRRLDAPWAPTQVAARRAPQAGAARGRAGGASWRTGTRSTTLHNSVRDMLIGHHAR